MTPWPPKALAPSRVRSLCGLAAAAMMAGCATVQPPPAPPGITPPAAWQQATGTPTEPAPQWWQALADPPLTALIEQALAGAPDLRSAQARVRQARALRNAASANRLPSVSASAGATRSLNRQDGSSSAANVFDAGFDATWEADLFGRLQAGADAAEADLAATRASLRDVQVSLQAEVARSVVELRSLQARAAIAGANLALQADTLQIARWRAQAGLVSQLDVDQALANSEQTRAQLLALQGSVAQAALGLELLLGRQPGALREVLQPADLPSLPPGVPLRLPADVLRQRADVRAAGQQWLAEAARTAQARAALQPRLTLGGSIGWRALTLGGLGDSLATQLFAGLAGPLFDAGRLRAQLDAQTASQERLAIAYETAVLAALGDVEAALSQLATARGRTAALTTSANAAAQAAELARTRYQSGLIDFRSVLDAERSVLAAQDSLAATRADALSAWIRLHKALGGGWDDGAAPPSPDPRPSS